MNPFSLCVICASLVTLLTSCSDINGILSPEAADINVLGGGDLYAAPRAFILSGRYEEANAAINAALSRDPKNSKLHFLNGIAYHLRALKGDAAQKELAQVGYYTALRIDPTNPQISYCQGLLNVSSGEYQRAVDALAHSIRYDPSNSATLNAFSVAAYQSMRPDLAYAVSKELVRRNAKDPDALRMKAMSAAAVGLSVDAEKTSEQIESEPDRNFVMRRVSEWGKAYKVASLEPGRSPASRTVRDDGSMQIALSLSDVASGMAKAAGGANGGPVASSTSGISKDEGAGSDKAFALGPQGQMPKMAMVDLIIIQTEENGQLIAGVNLLDTLSATAQSVGGLVRNSTEPSSFNFPSSDGGSLALNAGRTLAGQITLASAAYSLNIANNNVTKNDILARPTLVVTDNQTSTFNAGYTLSVALAGNIGVASSLVDKNVGLKVSITPTFLPGSRIGFKISASRSFFTPVELNARTFSQSVEQSIVEMNASAVIKMGSTLVLSGLTERQLQASRSQVPVLGELPGLQYLFANRTDTDKTRSVLILVTPREPKLFKNTLSLDNDDTPAVKDLKRSESRWFGLTDSPNYIQMMHHLVSNSLYQEYRTGDVMSETWQRPSSQAGRLNDVVKFLRF